MSSNRSYGPRLGAAALLTFLLATAATPASAQAGNSPYQPGGVGLSVGARQAILNSRVLGVRPRNMVRGADGSLVSITRRGDQALLRSSDTGEFIPGGRSSRGWGQGLGTGLGWGGSGGGYAAASGRGGGSGSIMQWISMLDFGGGSSFGTSLVPPSDGTTPLDMWIDQNELI